MSQIKLLLVDDREDNLLTMETILAQEGYHFVKAHSGKQALKILLKEQDFTLILMDVKMPDLNGFETAEMIYERDRLRHIPIIFITAYNYSEDKVYQGYKTGAVDYIYKPINPQLLKAKVGVFADLYKKNHQLLMQEQKLTSINKSLEKEIKERKVSEEKVKELNKKLVENIHTLEIANSELARFAYVASHDLQEPLRKIRAFGDLLIGKYHSVVDKNGQYYIERMQNASERMQTLIKDILSYSRLSGTHEPLSPVSLNRIIDELLGDLEIRIGESEALVHVSPLPELVVNPGQVRQLFQNLISNSLKFIRPGVRPEITISHEIVKASTLPYGNKVNADVDYCNIYVKDNGIGFEERYAEQIFTLFKRLNDNTHYEGTGIGLAICKKIVEQHKGFITAKSKINEGSLFIISLPLTPQLHATQQSESVSENSYSG
jgi:signal transduction histidine kinase